MATLQTIKEAIEYNLPLRQAEENIKFNEEQNKRDKEFKEAFRELLE